MTGGFDVGFDLRLNKPLSKQPWGWWLSTTSRWLDGVIVSKLCIFMEFTVSFNRATRVQVADWWLCLVTCSNYCACWGNFWKLIDSAIIFSLVEWGSIGPSSGSGTHFTNDFSITIQIRWKFNLALIQLLMIISRQNLAHATTAQLSCHVPNIVAITFLVFGWEQNEISITFELWWKNC